MRSAALATSVMLLACAHAPPPAAPPPPAGPPPAAPPEPAPVPDSLDALLDRIEAAYRAGRYDEGLSLIKRTLELPEKNVSVYDRIGSVYQRLGRMEEALAMWEQGLKLERSDKRRRELAETIVATRKALGLPASPALAGAARPPRPAVAKRAPPDPAAAAKAYEEGVAHYARGEYLQAGAAFRKALALDPSHDAARKALERLKLKPDSDGHPR